MSNNPIEAFVKMRRITLSSLLNEFGYGNCDNCDFRRERIPEHYETLEALLSSYPDLRNFLSDEQKAMLSKDVGIFCAHPSYVCRSEEALLLFVNVRALAKRAPDANPAAPKYGLSVLDAEMLMRAVPGQDGKFEYLAGCAWEGSDEEPEGLYVNGRRRHLFTQMPVVLAAKKRLAELSQDN